MTDYRSPLAIARDNWLDSDEGHRCATPLVLESKYLANRLKAAFIAGWNAKEAQIIAAASADRREG